MKNNIMEMIKKIDYVLMLAGFVIIIAFTIYFCFAELINIGQYRTRQEVTVSASEDKVENEKIDYIGKVNDVFAFAVKSSAIKTQEDNTLSEDDLSAGYESGNLINNKSSKDGNNGTVVNMLFVSENAEEEKRLFLSNVFIYRYWLEHFDHNAAAQNAEEVFHKNVYAVIEKDANNDGKLDSDDFVCLYVSDYDGSNLKKLAGNICFATVEKNLLVFADYKNEEKTYYCYDAEKDILTKIKTTKETVNKKVINLW